MTPLPWMILAKESFEASRALLEADRFRSGVSRAYYSMYQAATAIFMHAGLTPPERGNWDHNKMPTMFEDATVRRLVKAGRDDAIRLKQTLSALHHARSQADYVPAVVFDPEAAKNALRSAKRLLDVATRITGEG